MSERINNDQITLSHCLIDLLIDNEYEEIDSNLILGKTQKQLNENNFWMADDKIDLLRVYFQFSNNTIITEAYNDIKEDVSATVNEKLTDIIIRKCEFHQKKKLSLKKLYSLPAALDFCLILPRKSDRVRKDFVTSLNPKSLLSRVLSSSESFSFLSIYPLASFAIFLLSVETTILLIYLDFLA